MKLFKKLLPKLYKFDKNLLVYYKFSYKIPIMLILVYSLILSTCSYYNGYDKSLTDVENMIYNFDKSKESEFPTHNKVWEDSIFNDYEYRADLYLSRPLFNGTPLTGEMLSFCARNAYDSTGIIVPVELALAQAQYESSMGREGRSPIKNPFNVGEFDSGTVIWFSSTYKGVQKYYDLMVKDYLYCKTTEELLFDFTNCSGFRYAQSNYEINIGQQYYFVKKWLNVNKK